MNPGKLKNITTATTTTLASRPGNLKSVTINTTAAGTITIYDSLTATGTKLATIKASAAEGTYSYHGRFQTGLTVVTGAASDITVSWD